MSTILASPASVNNPPGLSLLPRKISDEETPPYDGKASNRREPFVMISHEVFREYAPKAGPIAWSVFTCLVFHADAAGRCFPSHATIAEETGIGSRTTVMTALAKLADLGMVRSETRRVASGAKTSNAYVLLVGMHVQKMDIPMFTSGTSHVQEMDIPCPEYEQELEPVNNIQRTKTENTPLPPKGEKPKQTQHEIPEDFQAFWSKYPPRKGRKDTKAESLAVWKKLPAADRAAALAAVEGYARSQLVRDGYAVDAVRWLRRGRWADEADAVDDPGPFAVAPLPPKEDPDEAAKRAADLEYKAKHLEKIGAPDWQIRNVERELGNARAAMEATA